MNRNEYDKRMSFIYKARMVASVITMTACGIYMLGAVAGFVLWLVGQ